MRRPNIRSAGADFVFAILALAIGIGGLPWPYLALTFVGAVVVWAWTRWAALNAMALRTRLTQSTLALIMLAAVIGIFYWIGLALGGHA